MNNFENLEQNKLQSIDGGSFSLLSSVDSLLTDVIDTVVDTVDAVVDIL